MAISTNKRLKAVQRGRDNSRVLANNKRQPRREHDSKKKERTKSRKKEVVSTKRGHYYENDVTGDETTVYD